MSDGIWQLTTKGWAPKWTDRLGTEDIIRRLESFAAPLFSSRKCGTSSSSNGCPTAFSWVTPDLNSDDGWFDAELSGVVHHCRGVANCALIGNLSAAGLLSVLPHIQPMYLTLAADNIIHFHIFDADVNADSGVLANLADWSEISRLPSLPSYLSWASGKYISQKLRACNSRLIVAKINWGLNLSVVMTIDFGTVLMINASS
ncbi:hypothetical protein K438DRAFT_1759632 [Mycena galopus ATCC 62051]|nr:hypothetical protein K438DRAFT_1759632 [Mycena galopus ATCC 62051]